MGIESPDRVRSSLPRNQFHRRDAENAEEEAMGDRKLALCFRPEGRTHHKIPGLGDGFDFQLSFSPRFRVSASNNRP
jgi:hypothetical protein